MIYRFEEILHMFYGHNLFKEINLLNYDEKYNELSSFLIKNYLDYFNDTKKVATEETIKSCIHKSNIIFKNINNFPNFNYVDKFEIIETGFGNFLKKVFNDIKILEIDFAFIENKIFLAINNNKTNIYEIIILSENREFDVEYLINIVKNEIIPDQKSLNKFILKLLIDYELLKLINIQNTIKINENFLFNLHSIKGSQKKYFNQIEIFNALNMDNNGNIYNSNINNQKTEIPKINFEVNKKYIK